MFGGADMVVAAIAYFSTNWAVFIVAMASVGLFASVAGVVTVRKANQIGIVKRRRESIISDIRRTSRSFFTSREMIKTTCCTVSFTSKVLFKSITVRGLNKGITNFDEIESLREFSLIYTIPLFQRF